MNSVVLAIIIAFIASLAMTISATFAQALNRRIPEFELNVFRSLAAIAMVLQLLIKVSIFHFS